MENYKLQNIGECYFISKSRHPQWVELSSLNVWYLLLLLLDHIPD
jgi:hypothetical protein